MSLSGTLSRHLDVDRRGMDSQVEGTHRCNYGNLYSPYLVGLGNLVLGRALHQAAKV